MPFVRSALAAAAALSIAACSGVASPSDPDDPRASTTPSILLPDATPKGGATQATATPPGDTSTGSLGSTRPAADTDPASQVDDTAYDNSAFVQANVDMLDEPEPTPPADLKERIAAGGLVIIHRYTGSGGSGGTAIQGSIDDGQRISEESIAKMENLGAVYTTLDAKVSTVLSSQYFFVYQHALTAMGTPVLMNRDLTGSLDFDDQAELDRSLQALRNRTVTPPPTGTNTVLFTHQGKFEKAYGYYLNAGHTMIFQPDGSGTPKVIASLSLDDWLALKN